MVANGNNTGRVVQIIGSTLDADFAQDSLPAIYNALTVNVERVVLGKTEKEVLWCEVAQHLGGGRIRAIALGSTDGLQRNSSITDLGHPVMVPVGEATLGRVFNLIGEPVDGRGEVKAETTRPER